MIANTILIALLFLVVIAGSWGIDHFGRAYGYHDDRVYRTGAAVFFVIGMSVIALLAWLQYDYIRNTVFEQTIEGSGELAPGTVSKRSIEFDIARPGEYELSILPQRPVGTDAHSPARLHVLLTNTRGEAAIDGDITVERNEITTVTEGGTYTTHEWKTWKQSFTAAEPGQHWLELNIYTTDIPEIHIRVATSG